MLFKESQIQNCLRPDLSPAERKRRVLTERSLCARHGSRPVAGLSYVVEREYSAVVNHKNS